MSLKKEWKSLSIIIAVFLVSYYLPEGRTRFDNAILEAFQLVRWYAREHVILCLVPAFFIAGAIGIFVSQASVMRYLGVKANKFLAYGVASVSGTILAVCSCTVLPLFAGIYRMGAGLGPATAFLYSGPAINVLAIILTARVLGIELGVARAVGAILFSVIIGLLMHVIFRKDETAKDSAQVFMPEPDESYRHLWKNVLYFAAMVGILVFVNWGQPGTNAGLWNVVYNAKWVITGGLAIAFALILVLWFDIKWWHAVLAGVPVILSIVILPHKPTVAFVFGIAGLTVISVINKGETGEWVVSSWGFAKQILPLLFIGVLFAGAFLGRPGSEGLIPSEWISKAVGGNSLSANFFASVAGAFMYFATLTEVPILQGLIGKGMGKGPALALLLAGPAISLPNMLVINSVMGLKKTGVFVCLVIIMATISGIIFGSM